MSNKNKYIKNYFEYEYLDGWKKVTLGEALSIWAEKYNDKTAVICGSESISYKKLNTASEEMAYGLAELGLKKEDRVIVQLPNRISFIKTLFAICKVGAVPILALPAHRKSEIEGILKTAEPKFYIGAEKYLGYNYIPMIEELKEKYNCLKHVIIDGKSDKYEALLSIKGSKKDFEKTDCYSTAILLLSGGTTGIPKLIPRTHSDYLYNAEMSARRCMVNEESVYLAALPVGHNFTLSCPGVLGTLSAGGKVVLAKNSCPDEIMDFIDREKVTITALVPSLASLCTEMIKCDDYYDLSSLKILQIGGAMLEESLAENIIENWPCKLMQVFGTAEGLICFTGLNDDESIILNCQGRPISEADEIKIVDICGKEVLDGQYGELLARGPYTIDHYYMNEEADSRSFTADGFYKTGDMAQITKEGNIRIKGRIKEQINRAGEKIIPSELERCLCMHDEIKEAAVVGIKDDVVGNKICAFVLIKEAALKKNITLSKINKFLNSLGVAQYKNLDMLKFIEAWPVTSIGKIDKKKLIKLAENAN